MVLFPYSDTWKIWFERLKAVYQAHLQDNVLSIEHVGSTSVPGMMAKAIIDIDIVIENRELLPKIIQLLAEIGYQYMGDNGIKDREAFKPIDEYAPYDQLATKWLAHHLYVCPQDSQELYRHIFFRDFLLKHPSAREKYNQIKLQIINEIGNEDRKLYQAYKDKLATDFINQIIEQGKI